MNARLLLIDPQNDFCDLPGAALPVAGADQDLRRLSGVLAAAAESIEELVITLDSHASVGIERTTFWMTHGGAEVPPFTQIVADDVRQGRFLPRADQHRAAVIRYLEQLENGGRYRLMVWPVHCVVGTWGHNLHADVAAQVAEWERRRQRPCVRILKGLNPMTEQYSAVQAEVPVADDPRTLPNQELIASVRPGEGLLLVAGEAASHCVAATMRDVFAHLSREERERVVLLTDCMSAVTGFQAQADEFLADAAARGARLCTARQALELLGRQCRPSAKEYR
jgi:nicotinamidase-related amidase